MREFSIDSPFPSEDSPFPSEIDGARPSRSEYDAYLGLSELLALQRPRSQPYRPQVYDSEGFFIIVHQAAELLLKQAVRDLNTVVATVSTPETDWDDAAARLARAKAVVELVRRHVDVLTHLPRAHFDQFRSLLGTASAGQSRQFAALFTLAGAGKQRGRVTEALLAARRDGAAVPQGVTGLAQALRGAVRRWQVAHVALVAEMVGTGAGTGGTAGVAWLRARIAPSATQDEVRP